MKTRITKKVIKLKEGSRREKAMDKKEKEKKPQQRIKGWDSNRWENSSADGIV